jgi:glucosamine--fructose-6-phosphate aminotransferase (isomerizing)
MCGIFGSTNFTNYEVLYDFNKQRGTFSYGGLYVTGTVGAMYITKQKGVVDLQSLDIGIEDHYNTFLGHTQAPTSIEREFRPMNSHPFECGNWIVAHNGVLSNFEELRSKYAPWSECNVDSSIIPILLDELATRFDDLELITKVLGMLEGTFGVWIYNKSTKRIYLARSGSTLFAKLDETGSFSSLQIDGFSELCENVIYELAKEGITQVGVFEGNSPFFI